MSCLHDTMTKNITVRLPDDLAADAEALARVEGKSANETVEQSPTEPAARRRNVPEFKVGVELVALSRRLRGGTGGSRCGQ